MNGRQAAPLTPARAVVNLDLRHLGEAYLTERLPFICSLAKKFVGVDPIHEPIPVRPTAHYTMGGIETNARCETRIKGLFAVGECSSVGLHGANRLGSNSLAELCVFGKVAGEDAWNTRAAPDTLPAKNNSRRWPKPRGSRLPS